MSSVLLREKNPLTVVSSNGKQRQKKTGAKCNANASGCRKPIFRENVGYSIMTQMALAIRNCKLEAPERNLSLNLLVTAMGNVISLGNCPRFLCQICCASNFVNNRSARNSAEGLQQAIPINLAQYVIDRISVTNTAQSATKTKM